MSNEIIAPAAEAPEYTPVEVNVKSLIEAGAHYGHQVQRWCPKMLPYIYTKRNGVHVINLDHTVSSWEKAQKFIKETAERGGTFLFVGTKTQARGIVLDAAKRCGAFYINNRWLGGALSNFETIKRSIAKMKKWEDMIAASNDPNSDIRISKKEKGVIQKELVKLEVNLGGIRDMKRPPDVVFIVDVVRDHIAVDEVRALHIPLVALVDTNADPDKVTYPIPCNDDAPKSVTLMANAIADTIIEGRKAYDRFRADAAARESAASNRGRGGQKGKAPAAAKTEEVAATETPATDVASF